MTKIRDGKAYTRENWGHIVLQVPGLMNENSTGVNGGRKEDGSRRCTNLIVIFFLIEKQGRKKRIKEEGKKNHQNSHLYFVPK